MHDIGVCDARRRRGIANLVAQALIVAIPQQINVIVSQI